MTYVQNMLKANSNAVKFLGWLKKFGPVQNILGPIKGQGIKSIEEKMSSSRDNLV